MAAIRGTRESDRDRNDLAHNSRAEAERAAREVIDRAADRTAPVGPPPSFAANVLDAERARLRQIEAPAEDSDARIAGTAGLAKAEEAAGAGAREVPATTRAHYGGVQQDPPRMLDVSR